MTGKNKLDVDNINNSSRSADVRPGVEMDKCRRSMTPTVQPSTIEIKDIKGMKKWVGDATMEEDGTIRIQMRMEDHGLVGEALHRYRPGNPNTI